MVRSGWSVDLKSEFAQLVGDLPPAFRQKGLSKRFTTVNGVYVSNEDTTKHRIKNTILEKGTTMTTKWILYETAACGW